MCLLLHGCCCCLLPCCCLVPQSLLAYRYKFGPPSQQPRADKQRLMQQVRNMT